MTNLRYLRLKYNISTVALAAQGPHSQQQLSRLELGDATLVDGIIEEYQKALECIIKLRKKNLAELEQDYLKVKDKLFEEATP